MLKDVVQKQMVDAMKSGDKDRKRALSLLLAALKNKEIEKRPNFTEQDELDTVAKMAKQVKESIELTPADRVETIKQLESELEVYKKFMPKQMTEEEIKKIIVEVIDKLQIKGTAAAKNRGIIMHELMPLVKGRADGKLVNQLLIEYLK